MEAEDAITFSQTSFNSAFVCFDEMRRTGELCDLAIRVANVPLTTHRVVLAARIPYFRSVFSDVTAGETDISISDFDPTVLESLINFAYTGTINISIENAPSVLQASFFFQLEEVSDACVEFLSKRLLPSRVLQVLNLGSSLNESKLIGNCFRFMQENFEEFSRTDDFRSLSGSTIKEIISVDDLNVTNEKMVIEAVLNWVRYLPSERQVMLPELLREVRMIYLPVDYLIERISSEEVIRESLVCRNLIDEVKNYHFRKNDSECLNLKKEPRKYKIQPGIYAICKYGFNELYIYQYGFVNDTWRQLMSWTYSHTEGKDSISNVVAVNGKLYIFFKEIIQTFHPQTLEWQQLEARHGLIEGATVVSHGKTIYCFGSYDADFDCMLQRFDTEHNTWLQQEKMKTAKCTAAAANLGEFIYVTGGYDRGMYLSTVDKYNPLTGEWTEVAPMLTARRRHGCVSTNGNIYVFGGRSYDHYSQTGEMYNPLTDTWNFVSSMKLPRCDFSLVCHSNEIYAIGDFGNSAAFRRETEIYDPKADKWRPGVSVPVKHHHAVSMLDD